MLVQKRRLLPSRTVFPNMSGAEGCAETSFEVDVGVLLDVVKESFRQSRP